MAAATRNRGRPGKEPLRNEESNPLAKAAVPYQPWTPSLYTAFKALLSARLCAAIWSNISDCDEIFNYWEPTHYLVHGNGFQTWEYSPVFAIRSYAYLWIHALPLQLYTQFLQPNKVLAFYFLRCLLAFCCAVCEAYFYKGICKQFGANTGRVTLCFLVFSTGMFISCAAYLPSSFTMYLTMVAMGAWFLGQNKVAIFAIAASALLGWPFAGALGIPIAVDFVFRRKKLLFFVQWAVVALIAFLMPAIQVDSHYYGKMVIAPLNIVLYNVFSDHGPNIYGVEPWSFYFLNGFLNFNIVFILALVAFPFAMAVTLYLRQPNRGLPMWLTMAPMYIWILIFFTRPHKEERFLFPIYPLFCLAGAVAVDYIQKLYSHMRNKRHSRHYTESGTWLTLLVIVVFSLVSTSRSMALYKGYHAPLDVYLELNNIVSDPKIHSLSPDKHVNICVGKEWYRFPGSFFLPNDKWHLQFIQSDFKGQLPKQYSSSPDATKIIPTHMNDQNLEESTRYINSTRCHYLIDLDTASETPLEPRYSQRPKEWKVITSTRFLDNERSHRLFRAFYIPFLSEQKCTYINYNLLKTTRTKRSQT